MVECQVPERQVVECAVFVYGEGGPAFGVCRG